MAVNKAHDEFFAVDFEDGWEVPIGYPEGIQQKILSGSLDDANGHGGEPFTANTYACRPPGAPHGPFKSEGGCLIFEIHYYDPA